ncbi:MAG: lysophospholipid acyltransferase family protein, partial [Chloroflexota bacterium]
MRNLALYASLVLAGRIIPIVPRALLYRAAQAAGTLAYYLSRSARTGIQSNLAVAFPHLHPQARNRYARQAFRTDALNWADTLRIPRLQPGEISRSVRVHNWELLEEALRQQRGAILVTMHLGNFDLVGQLLVARGVALTVPVERIRPERLFRLLKEQRGSQGIHIVSIEDAPRAMLTALKHGETVGITADRHVAGKTVPVQFFGREVQLARGAVSLARRSGAPLFMAIGVRRPDGQFDGFIVPIESPSEISGAAEVERGNLQQLAHT